MTFKRLSKARSGSLSPGGLALVAVLCLPAVCRAQSQAAENRVTLLEIEGVVEFAPPAKPLHWHRGHAGEVLFPGYQLRTGPRSRATVRLSDLTVLPIGPRGHLQVFPEPKRQTVLDVFKGVIYLFRREKPGDYHLRTPTVSAVVRGTEFSLEVREDGATVLTVLNGAVDLTNGFGALRLRGGQAALVEPGHAPEEAMFIEAAHIVQWRLYYPGALHLDDLELPADLEEALAESLSAYRQGDLQTALARYPAGRQPQSSLERVYLAALLLVVGEVDQSLRLLDGVADTEDRSKARRLTAALRQTIAAVKFETANPAEPAGKERLATEWLAESYYRQSRGDLAGALDAARLAVGKGPKFGLGWARLAELEFGFGNRSAALKALDRSLELAPRNAQSFALRGFLLSAESRIEEAVFEFDRAIGLDGALGNAWLGRGLCAIRRGRIGAGLQDLQVAATLEPQRALFRSYLGKAFNHLGDLDHAEAELRRAVTLDPADPTAWLYAALLHQQENRINPAVRDLERSQALNDHRWLYRSKLLLDRDRAVRGANLASVYGDAGMEDVSRREAVRAVNRAYADYSAHLFLANSYSQLRDPRQFNLRFETPSVSEYLLANLLAPAGAQTLSPLVSQNEYTRLFEHDRLGLVSVSENNSNGDVHQSLAQFGIRGRSSYAAELAFDREKGYRPNNDLDQISLGLRLKHDLTPEDQLYFQALYYEATRGDLRQLYDPANALTGLRVKEALEPLMVAGYHREWAPGSHTLLLAGRIGDTVRLANPDHPVLVVRDTPTLFQEGLPAEDPEIEFERDIVVYSAELQQIWEHAPHTMVVGARLQFGEFDSASRLGPGKTVFTNGILSPTFTYNPEPQNAMTDFQRAGLYGYEQWRPADPLLLTAGLAFDYLRFPLNTGISSLTTEEETLKAVLPKVGGIWTPWPNTTVRAAYTRSLGGVTFDQSVRLEPTQVGGFNQAFRSLIPESVAGSTAGAKFETWGVALDQKLARGTYLGLQAERLGADVDRRIGLIEADAFFNTSHASTPETLEYEERTLTVGLDQLLGDRWSIGTHYRLGAAELARTRPSIPTQPPGREEAVLHQVKLFARFHHETGWFGQVDSIWSQQSNSGYAPGRPGDAFWQVNLSGGYRFFRRRAEVRVSLLNLTDQDYRLNPLNLIPELPRERVFAASLRLAF